jgi:hypothetical protein
MADQTALLVDPEALMSIALRCSDRPRRIDRIIDYFGDCRDAARVAYRIRLGVPGIRP